MSIPTLTISAAQTTKQEIHELGQDFHPMWEMWKDNKRIAAVAHTWENDTDKKIATLKVLHVAQAMEVTGLLLITDAYVAEPKALDDRTVEEFMESEDYLPPSQDPTAREALTFMRWENGELDEASLTAYSYDDDGSIHFDEKELMPTEATIESWIDHMVKRSHEYEGQLYDDDVPPEAAFMWLLEEGMQVMVCKEVDAVLTERYGHGINEVSE